MKKKSLLSALSAFLICPLFVSAVVTNPYREDGFGSQYQTIIYTMIYAELAGDTFVYTPFRSIEHNYDQDPNFIQKKEWLINLIDHFPINHDIHLQVRFTASQFISFIETHFQAAVISHALKKARTLFRLNKDRKNYFDEEHFHIAVHIRRPNSHDNRVAGTNSPDSIYSKTINQLRETYRSKNPLFHLFSQGHEDGFKNAFPGSDIVYHINESVEETFPALVFADALVTSTSSLSYTAGLLSEGVVYYVPFWHPPSPYWKVIE